MLGSEKLCGFAGVLALVCITLPAAYAAQGKIVCWKDAAGKVIGCGDKVPPEFQNSATKQLDARGVTRGTTESVEEANRRRQKEQEAARVKADDQRKSVEQTRHDRALLETYSNENEIDLKRDRDLQVLDLQIEQLGMSLKNATQRHEDAAARLQAAEKSSKAVSPQLKNELARSGTDKERFEKGIQAKNQEKEDLRALYAEQRRRYIELRNNPGAIGIAPGPPASVSASAAPGLKK
jgi:hypothetical protein